MGAIKETIRMRRVCVERMYRQIKSTVARCLLEVRSFSYRELVSIGHTVRISSVL